MLKITSLLRACFQCGISVERGPWGVILPSVVADPYTDTVAVRVPSEVKARLEVLAERDGVALGIVLRQVIEAGLPEIEGAGPEHHEQASAEVRAWWGNLPRRERTRWGKRLGELDGTAFLQEAYRQAMAEEGR